jgi:hypothetical protein
MPSPAGAIYRQDATGQYLVWDEDTQEYIPAVSTPDVSTSAIPLQYKLVFDQAAPGLTEKIAEAQKPGESWTDTYGRIASSLLMTVQQYQLINLNTERAKKGLPPVDIASYSGVGVNIGLSPSTQQLLIFGGLAVAALVLLTRSGK